jgi:probable H4MPT-linked C1 transfer pathway protein
VHDDATFEIEYRDDPHRPLYHALIPGQDQPVIGLDVGGANTKAAVVYGDERVEIVSEPFEVWRQPEALAGAIASVVQRLGVDRAPVALTTTAELVDVFASKREGVLYVLEAALQALPGRRLRVMSTAGELIGLEQARAGPLRCAAANWMATAMLIARSLPDAILLDCGGTTTDLIPIVAGAVAARGRTDVERLREGELVYTGALRTNIAAVLSHVPIGGKPCPVASELFAISADAHLLRGSLTAKQCTCTFPDGRGPSRPEVRARLARVVCADPEQLADGDLEAIAAAVEVAQTASIATALARVAERVPAGTGVIAVGVGAFLARAAAERRGLPVLPDASSPSILAGEGAGVAAAVALSVLGRD